MNGRTLQESATNAIRYWEPRRIAYNVVLAAITLVYFAAFYPKSRAALTLDGILILFLLAVLANVAYCSAYLADIFFQASDYIDAWRKYRWVLFVIGTAFAGVITRLISIGVFSNGGS